MREITNAWKVRMWHLKMLHNRNGTPVLLFFSEIRDPMKQVISAILVVVESNCPSGDDNLVTDIRITLGGGGGLGGFWPDQTRISSVNFSTTLRFVEVRIGSHTITKANESSPSAESYPEEKHSPAPDTIDDLEKFAVEEVSFDPEIPEMRLRIRVIFEKVIFESPLDAYWKKKLRDEVEAEEN
ncbi:hypothetical protein ACH5RR_036026 [Cinchona calisaya]|uniref:Uncharacterized protein n=1 Tax=Cinchona calisaya TaxID=153742 RepID=A0ABD2Y585_9GENT